MNAADLIGYAFDGALYCPTHAPRAKSTGCTCGKADENGVCMSNCHGYGPSAVFLDNGQPGDACDLPGCGYLAGCDPAESEE